MLITVGHSNESIWSLPVSIYSFLDCKNSDGKNSLTFT